MEHDQTSLLASVKKYEDTLARDPRSCCFAPLAELYCRLGLHDEALTVVRNGVELHPDYPGGYLALGKAYLGKGMVPEGMAALEHALRLTPDNHIALKILGQLYQGAGRNQDALALFRRVVELNPRDDESRAVVDLLVRTSVLETGYEVDGAVPVESPEEELCSSFDLPTDPMPNHGPLTGQPGRVDDPLVTPTLAEMYVKQGFVDEALDIYRQLLQGDPDNVTYLSRVAQISATCTSSDSEGTSSMPPAQREENGEGLSASSPVENDGVADVGVERRFELLLAKIERRRACLFGRY